MRWDHRRAPATLMSSHSDQTISAIMPPAYIAMHGHGMHGHGMHGHVHSDQTMSAIMPPAPSGHCWLLDDHRTDHHKRHPVVPPNAFNVHVLSVQSSVFSVQRTDHDKRHPVVPNHALCIVPGVDSWVGVAGHLLLASIAHEQTLAFFEDRHPLLLRSGAVVDVCNTTIHQPQHLRSVVSVRW